MSVTLAKARRAKEELENALANEPNLVGIGITKIGADYAVKVNFARKPVRKLPQTFSGVAVVLAVVGRIRKQPS